MPKIHRFIEALKRSYKTPESVLARLGLDQSLLEPGSEVFDTTDAAIAALREMVSKMDPDEREHFIQLLSESDIGELLLAGTTAEDEPLAVPGMPKTGGTLDPLASYAGDQQYEPRLRAMDRAVRAAQDAKMDARMRTSGSRQVAKAYAGGTPALALDHSDSRSFTKMFGDAANRIGKI